MNDVVRTYENYREEDRLSTDNARKTEFITTMRIFDELFKPHSEILDCAAGTGAYAFALTERGHKLTATDITPRHIEYIRNKDTSNKIKTAVLDASDLSCFKDESFDVVLNMGPYYHITEEEKRIQNLSECKRVLKCGGLLVTAYISRFFLFPFVALDNTHYLNSDFSSQIIDRGVLTHDDKNCFWTDTYYSSPSETEQLYSSLGLKTADHFAQDGISIVMRDRVNSLDTEQFKLWCDYHYRTCREKSILGSSNHAVIIGIK